ncbi:MAG: hypothetical protein ACJ76I_12135, partial [Gaiellaceae bacterium]
MGPGPIDGPLAATAQMQTGTIKVTTTTRGVELDPDGYTVTVDSVGKKAQSKTVPDSGMAQFANANAGTRTVTLTGIASNCSAATNPQIVQLATNATATVAFAVTCQATKGTLTINTTTTGADLDPDGYSVTVDGNGTTAKAIATNGTVSFSGLTAGTHTILLLGLAPNCSTANSQQTVTITAGATTTASYAVNCVATTGTLNVTAATTGAELDPDGYTVSVDGGTGQPLTVNGSATFAQLTPGSHTVTLAGLAPNCTAASNPQSVTITAGVSSGVTFNVSCVTTKGSLTVSTTTTGADLDPDGYAVAVDGGAPQAIAVNGTLTVAGLTAGTHTVALSGLAANCTTTNNPQTVTITAGATTSASFTVSCTAIPTNGNLTVTAATTGVEPDADGYTVSVDGGPAQAIASNGSVSFPGLSAGSHTVTLAGIAPNCAAATNPQTVTITAGSSASATFNVTCVTTKGTLSVNTTTSGADLDPDGYTVTLDGAPATAQPIATNGSTAFANLSAGTHTVALSALAANCTVTGSNSQTVTVTAGATTSASFTVSCTAIPTTGDLTVTASTTGVELDPDGYSVSVDGSAARAIASNGSLSFAGLSAGSHTVTLAGLAPNCSAAANPQTVTIVAGSTSTLAFSVSCVTTSGAVTASTTTTGADLDPDGYSLTLDGDAATTRAVAVNGSVTFSNLTTGAHTIALGGVAANCTAATSTQTVNVVAGATASASFTITCTAIPTTGDLTVTSTTAGVEPDVDGYTATLDGNSATARTLGSNASIAYTGLSAGTHTVALSGLAANCSAASNPQSVTVIAGSTASLAFNITCVTTKGTIAVSTTTTGADLDPDGYTVALDGGAPQAIAVNGTLTFAGLSAGAHTIALGALAGNCTVTGVNPQTVTVTAGATTNAGFAVSCTAIPTTGGLTVSTATTGVEQDADGYTLSLDGGAAQAIATNGSLSFSGLAPGAHTVSLGGIAANCTADANPRTVSITAGSTTTLAFTINCVTTKGAISVAATTTGADLDPDGYSASIDGGAAQALAINGSVSFAGLSAASHTVTLAGLAPNCTTTNNPRSVTVGAGATTNVSYAITCTAIPTTGALTVTTATTGVEQDADGYTVSVDGGTARAIPTNGSLSFSSLTPGSHSVTLGGLAPNCTAAANPQTATITAGSTTDQTFNITCVTTKGSIALSTSTTGADRDPDGYSVALDGGASQPIATNGSVTLANLVAGAHTLVLSGLAANCAVTSANPQSVTVTAGATTSASFTVTCTAIPTTGDLTVTAATTGVELDPDGYTVSVDGGAARALASNGSATFPALAAGTHTVAISGLAANCTTTTNPQTVTIVAGSSASTTFNVSCVTTKGTLAVSTTTTGADLDPDGYAVAVDGGTAQPIATNGSVSVANLSAGTHTITLAGLAANCTVTGSNPQTATVTAGATTNAGFTITCTAIPTTGDLTVTASTTGVELDADGYTVSVDGGAARALATNGSLTIPGLSAGTHTVTLAGLAPNCTAASNPQSTTIGAGSTSTLTFSVTCVTTKGSLTVSTTTTGADLDPDGYAVAVDGGAPQAIAVNGTLTVAGLTAGAHTVTLSGLAANCTTTTNPQTVTITAGATTTTGFTVTCTAIPTTGTLTVTAATTGVELDPDGYTVSVDGGTGQPLTVNGSATFAQLTAGSHTVTLSGLAPNCTTTTNPRTVTIVAGSSASTTFNVTCVTTKGTLAVTTTTTGADLDPDGYAVAVDGGTAQPIATNGSVTVANLSAGAHTVTLSGLAANCTVSGANPQTASISAGVTTNAGFTVACTAIPTTGDLTVTATTTGVELDPDGYTVSVDGGTARALAINGSATFPALAAGTHTVAISGLAANCTTTTNPRTVTIVAGSSATTTFTVSCVTTKGSLAVSTSTTGADLDPDGYAVAVDGGAAQAIAVNGTLTVAGLSAGSHTVTLSGLAPNCTTATNPQTASVTAGATVNVSFAVTCVTTHGDLAVTATTTGVELDPDGYQVNVDGGAAQALAVNGTANFPALAGGTHTVTLTALAPNCTAAANPQTVSVVAGTTTTLGFNVSCLTTHGDLRVTTATTGVELDPDGYAVRVDGGTPQAVAINGSVTFAALTAGSHSLTLSGLAANCTVSGANPQTVTVAAGTTTTSSFAVSCVATTGALTVTTATTGSDLDPDGYTASVDGGAPLALGINASITFGTLSPGSHTVTLSGLAPNCTAATNPQTATVAAGGTTSLSFAINCASTHGDLIVSTTTTGADPDPDGYTVTLDGNAATAKAVSTNGSVTFPALAAGSHTVVLSGLASNCSTTSPQTVSVAGGSAATLAFSITCVTTHGDLAVTTATTGVELDPDGYTVSVDGGTAQAISINGSATFAALTAGSHTVTLSALAPNCTVSGANPRTVTAVAGTTTTSNFAVSCAATTGDLTVSATTTGSDLDPDGYAVTIDGGAPKAITVNGTAAFPGLAPGSHSVALTGLAPNCTTTSPQTATIVAGTTTSASFTITCVTTHGDLAVTTTTSGVELDPDGYAVAVDGGAARPVGVNGSVTFTALAAGSHTLTLSGLSANCAAAGNPQTVTVLAGTTTTAAFSVTCATTHGSLVVTAATTGADLDPDGYSVTVDGDAATLKAIAVNGSVTYAGLTQGSHSVAVGGLAPNCNAATNPQPVTVAAGGTVTLGFTITCVTTHGDLAVSAATTGAELDPDGYGVSVDGGSAQPIGVNGSVSFIALAGGAHSVTLSGLAPNCAAATNPQTVTVVAGTTTTLAFTVTCAATTGALTVTAATTGSDLDPDGYTVSVDGGAPRALGINASITFGTLSPGSHTATLSGLAANCSVTGSNPQTATITAGTTTNASFAVSCTAIPTVGSLTVSTATTGVEQDVDGYTVRLDGGATQAIASNGSLSLSGLAPGTHTVTLGGIAPNCTAASNPQSTTIVAGSTSTLTFTVSCVTTKGTLAVTTTTTGADLDPDGYTLTVQSDAPITQPIGVNGSATVPGLSAGAHTVTLSGLAANCTVTGSNPQTVTVTAGATTNASFAVSCTAIPTTGDLTVTAATTGVELDPDGYTVSVDGGAARALAINGSVSILGLSAGTHTVTLAGLAPNCTAATNPQSTTITAGASSGVTFNVSCVTTKGSLTVSTTTTGADLDPDGYAVAVDGGAPQA